MAALSIGLLKEVTALTLAGETFLSPASMMHPKYSTWVLAYWIFFFEARCPLLAKWSNKLCESTSQASNSALESKRSSVYWIKVDPLFGSQSSNVAFNTIEKADGLSTKPCGRQVQVN